MKLHKIELTGYCVKSPEGPALYLGTAGSYGNEQLAVTLGKGWEGLTVTATFQPAGVTVLVPGDGTLDVPWEATETALDAAKGRIVFEGVTDGRVLISTDIPYAVGSHSDTEGSNSQPPTPSQWEQFVDEVKGDADRAEQAAKDAEVSVQTVKDAGAQAVTDIGAAKDSALDAIVKAGEEAAGSITADVQAAKDAAAAAEQSAEDAAAELPKVQQAGQTALDDIATERENSLTALEDEGDKQQSAVAGAGASALEAIQQAGQTVTGQITQTGATQVGAVQSAGTTQVGLVNSAGQQQTENIAQAGSQQVQAVQVAGTAAVSAVNDARDEAVEEIEAANAHAPQINSATGYWQTWDAETGEYVDTTTKAEGPKGDKGDPGEPGLGVPQPTLADVGKVPVVNAEGNGYVLQNISTGGGGTGEAGADGGYYTPSVAQDGTLSWTPSDPAMPDVPSANIKGPKGDPGPQGAPGQDGQPGTAATITVGTVTTLEPGQPATVTNAGSETAAVFNFGIPKGEPGEDGSAGLPTPTAADAGKALAVKPDGTGYQLAGPYAPLSAAIRPTASGNPVSITDSVEWSLLGLKVYGKSTQDGTPSPENPVPIVSAGDEGSIALTVFDGADQSQSLTVSTPTGLPGIPVDSGGNYTDAEGQQRVCDEIDSAREICVQRIGHGILDGTNLKFETAEDGLFWNAQNSAPGLSNEGIVISNTFPVKVLLGNRRNGFIFTQPDLMSPYFQTVDELNAFLVQKNTEGNPVEFYYIKNPIETPLPEEELTAYRALHTYDGTTVVSTAEDVAGLEVKYVADAQKYIDNRLTAAESHIQEIAAAQLNAQTGG